MPRQQIVSDRIGKPSGHFSQANAIEARGPDCVHFRHDLEMRRWNDRRRRRYRGANPANVRKRQSGGRGGRRHDGRYLPRRRLREGHVRVRHHPSRPARVFPQPAAGLHDGRGQRLHASRLPHRNGGDRGASRTDGYDRARAVRSAGADTAAGAAAVARVPPRDPGKRADHLARGSLPRRRHGAAVFRPQELPAQCAGRDPSRAGGQSRELSAHPRPRSAFCARSPATACCSACGDAWRLQRRTVAPALGPRVHAVTVPSHHGIDGRRHWTRRLGSTASTC